MKISSSALVNIVLAMLLVTSMFFVATENSSGNNEANTSNCGSADVGDYDPWAY